MLFVEPPLIGGFSLLENTGFFNYMKDFKFPAGI